MRISLCLLVWNEVEGCRIDLPQLPREAFDEVYAVDGGSTDSTVAYLESENIPVYRQPKKGLNAAYLHAVEKSRCDAVVVFLPKGTVPPADTLKFRPLLEAGCELVVASRHIKGARNEEDDRIVKPRKWGVCALSALVACLWRREGYWIRDVLHGFRAFTVEGFRRMNPSPHGLSIDLELVVRSYQLRLQRAEFSTSEVARPHGQTHFKLLPTGLKLLGYLVREMRKACLSDSK